MNTVCFTLFGRPIYWYGVFVAAGFLAAVSHWNLLGKKRGFPPGFGSELGFWIMLAGIIGARIAYVFSNFNYYIDQPLEIIRFDKGGLIYYGGFFGGILGVILFALTRKKSLWETGDFTIVAIPLAHAFGRIGCFMNACCYGSATTFSWSVHQHGELRHPTQLYEVLTNLGIYVLLSWYAPRKPFPGSLVALYLIFYPLGRFLIEFLRGDDRMNLLGLHFAQGISILLWGLGVLLWFLLPRITKRNASSPS